MQRNAEVVVQATSTPGNAGVPLELTLKPTLQL